MKLKKIYPFLFLLLGFAGLGIRNWLYQVSVDETNLLIPGTVPEILLWVLTAVVIIGAVVLCRGSVVGENDRFVEALGSLIFAAGIFSLLQIPAIGPAPLVMVQRIASWAAVGSLVVAAIMCIIGKKPFYLLTVAPCVLALVQLVECYQLWSERPALLNYFFGVGAVLTTALHAYHRMARSAVLKTGAFSAAVSLMGIFFCVVATAQGEYALYFGAAALWMTAELFGLTEQTAEA